MNHILLSLFCASMMMCKTALAQLPPVAQALYNDAFQQDSSMVQYAINNGAQFKATPDGNSFYIQWFPTGSQPSSAPLIVSLHGSDGFATHEFYSWHPQAQLHGCGIVALQWFRGHAAIPPNDYFDDAALYSYIDSALTRIGYSGKALFHGFSRGAARSYAVVFKDAHGGKNYFCTVMSNSGGASPSYPLYAQIDSGLYGNNVFAGKQWNLFCGGHDPNPTVSGCVAMTDTKAWLQGQGATVHHFIQDTALGHDGFQLQTSYAYKDSVLNNYLACFNGTAIGEVDSKSSIDLFPNPLSSEGVIRLPFQLYQARICIYDARGQLVRGMDNMNGSGIRIMREDLPPGIYVIRIADAAHQLPAIRMVVMD